MYSHLCHVAVVLSLSGGGDAEASAGSDACDPPQATIAGYQALHTSQNLCF